MKRENLYQPFRISFNELNVSLLKKHNHTFFELVCIYLQQVFNGLTVNKLTCILSVDQNTYRSGFRQDIKES